MLIRIGDIIQDAREYKEITRAELADFTFVSEEQVEATEENRIVPDFDAAFLLCHYPNGSVGIRFRSTSHPTL